MIWQEKKYDCLKDCMSENGENYVCIFKQVTLPIMFYCGSIFCAFYYREHAEYQFS